MKVKYLRLLIIVISAAGSIGMPAHGQNVTNMAGTWNGIYLAVPSQLTIQHSAPVFGPFTNLHSVVTNILEKGAFEAGEFQVNFLANGTFTNQEGSGALVVGSQGELTVLPAGESPIHFRVNAAEDVGAGISTNTTTVNNNEEVGINELNLIVRAPATLATNDLTGTWSLMLFDTPGELIQQYASNSPVPNVTPLTAVLGRDNSSVGSSTFGQTVIGTMTFNADGTLSAVVEEALSGTFSVAAGGLVTLTLPDGNFTNTAFVNAGKNTMFALHSEPDNNRQEILMLAKNPTGATLAGLQGLWKITTFKLTPHLFLSSDTNGYVTEVTPDGGFIIEQQAIAVGNDGFVTGILDGLPTIGTFTLGAGGAATLLTTNSIGGVDNRTGTLNAALDAITMVRNNKSLSVLTRSPNVTTNRQDLGLLLFNSKLVWAAASNRKLQREGALNGSWVDVPGTLGQHEYQPLYTNTAGFFQVKQ